MNESEAFARLEREREVFRDNIKNCRAALRMIREAVRCRQKKTWSRRLQPRQKLW